MAGSQALGKAIEVLDQLTALAGAGVPLIAMGRTVVALIRELTTSAPQATREQAEVALAKWESAESVAIERNQSWLDTHPRQ